MDHSNRSTGSPYVHASRTLIQLDLGDLRDLLKRGCFKAYIFEADYPSALIASVEFHIPRLLGSTLAPPPIPI